MAARPRVIIPPVPAVGAAPDAAAAVADWWRWLAEERRTSPHTLDAYGRDLAAFLAFLAEHLGGIDPAATMIVCQLIRPEMLIEIEVTAQVE